MTDIAGLCERLWSGCIYMRDSNTNCVVNREETDALLAETADTIERQAAEIERLRDNLLGIALSDRYRRYPKQHEDGGIRGQSGLRAVRALTGQHGSYLSDDDVVRLDKEARAAITGEDRV